MGTTGLTSTEREKLFLAGESGHYNYLHASKISNGTLSRKKSLRGTLSRAKNTTTHANAATPEDSTQFAILREHLKSLGVGKKLQSFIFQVVAAVLHIGNLQFANDPMKPQDPAAVKNRDVLLHACTLLGVSESDLEQLMTYQTKMIGMELCSVIMTLDEANDRRDELSRALYSLLFSWLLTKINDRLCKEEAGVDNFISILDFPSLKTMDQNTGPLGFYDFCSNIAYERITQFMDSKTITGRDIAYKGEMLSPPPLEFIDHTAILKLLTGPSGIATCINEETCANQNAETLTNALNSQFTRSENYIPSSRCSPNMSSPESEQNFVFGIRHNFARVEYTVNDFKHRNLEVISSDFVAMFQNANNAPTPDAKEDESFSINIFLANLFSTKMGVEVESKGGQIVSAKMNATLKRNPSIKKKGGKSAQKSKTISTSDTALSNLITTLDDLMVCISNTKIYLVLCVNPFEPNIERISMSMLRQQLESLSVPSLATSRAFANVALPGITYDEFEAQFGGVVAKYANISDGIGPAIDQIAKKNKWNPRDLILGRTQMFLSDARWRWFKSHAPVEMPDLQRRNSISESVASFQDGTESPNYSADAFEVESEYGGELGKPAGRREDKVEFGAFNKDVAPPKKEIVQAVEKITGVRKAWVCITWSLTWWIPSIFLRCCGKMKRPDIRMAWREKVALCILIFLLNASLLFVIIGLRYIICPPLNIKSEAEISDMGSPWVSAQGRYYQVQGLYDTHMRSLGEGRGQSAGALAPFEFTSFYGKNVGGLFFKQDTWGSYCPNLPEPQAGWDYLDAAVEPKRPLPSSPAYNAHRIYAPDGRAIPLIEGMRPFVKGSIGYTAQTVQGISSSTTVHLFLLRFFEQGINAHSRYMS